MTRTALTRGSAACLILTWMCAAARAQDQDPDKVQELEQKVADLEGQVSALKEQQAQAQAENDESFDDVDQRMLDLSGLAGAVKSGTHRFLVTGFARAGFVNAEGEDSTFTAGLNPIFLWMLSDRLFVEGELELELEGDETEVGLEYVQMSYVLNDSAIFGMGKFLSPANPFAERLHPAWINKLPDFPLAFGEFRIMPSTQVGAQVHGAVPLGSSKMTYAVYVSNGPSLVDDDPAAYGSLEFSNYEDTNNNKAVGGRLAYFVLPELELGYSLEIGQVTPSGSASADADALIQSVDLNYTTSVAKGVLDVRGQWAFSDVDDVVYDPSGASGFGPVTLDNTRDGGYVQGAFRPSEASNSTVASLEGVVRYDAVNLPTGAPEGVDESRITLGLNYWLAPSSVCKLAYSIDDKDSPGMDSNAVVFQWATGF